MKRQTQSTPRRSDDKCRWNDGKCGTKTIVSWTNTDRCKKDECVSMYASKMLQLGETEARLYAYFTTAECDHATRSKLIADGNENLLRVRCQNKTHKAASVVYRLHSGAGCVAGDTNHLFHRRYGAPRVVVTRNVSLAIRSISSPTVPFRSVRSLGPICLRSRASRARWTSSPVGCSV